MAISPALIQGGGVPLAPRQSGPPTDELGVTNTSAPLLTSVPGWGILAGPVDDLERSPALKWPLSVRETYPAMRNDSQVEALYTATTLPIRRYRWMIDPNGARDEVVQGISRELNLPIKGADQMPVPRAKGRFVWGEHLKLVLFGLLAGHYFFEQSGYIGDDGMWHLSKLAPRAPHTLELISVAADGGLIAIRQRIGKFGAPPEWIPVDRLVAYVWDQEPGRWVGRSMLRSIYREWRLKDELLRVDAYKHSRNGMGVPTAKATQPDVTAAQLAEGQKIAAAWRAGAEASAALPYGVDIELKGVQGTLPDTLASINRHDEAMARRWLAMVIQLGQTMHGSRALGAEFSDFMQLGQDAIAAWVCDTASEHIVEDWVDWNYGEAEQNVPRVAYERDDSPELAIADLVALIDKGAISVDPELEQVLRARYGLPAASNPGSGIAQGGGSDGGGGDPVAARQVAAEASTELPLPDRQLRRQPYDHEVAAAVDFRSIDATWQSQLDSLISAWQPVRAGQIEQLRSAVETAAGDFTALAELGVTTDGQGLLSERMQAMYEEGQRSATQEAQSQGVQPAVISTVPEERQASLLQRAIGTATTLGRTLANAAAKRAIELTGGGLTTQEVATKTVEHLNGLSDSYLRDELGGALTAALNAGRSDTMRATGAKTIYSSELLDASTCMACSQIDGTEYTSIDDAERDYPNGGYTECAGGSRCRGTLVATYAEGEATLQ